MVYCFDIDGTLCSQVQGDYRLAVAILDRITHVNLLRNEGHVIKLFTARGATSGIDWRQETVLQLEEWGLEYDELIMGKPHADYFIDDKATDSDDYFSRVLGG
jgi:hypothetical protein